MTVTNLAADLTVFTSNVYLVRGEQTVLVDPGANFDVVAHITEHVATLDAVVITHTHEDHVENLPAVTDAFDVDVWGYDTTFDGIEFALEDGDSIQLGDSEYDVLFTPGHASDHLCFYSEADATLFSGDLIFPDGNVGRTDLAGCDHDALLESIERTTDVVTDSLECLYAGHMPMVSENASAHVTRATPSL